MGTPFYGWVVVFLSYNCGLYGLSRRLSQNFLLVGAWWINISMSKEIVGREMMELLSSHCHLQ